MKTDPTELTVIWKYDVPQPGDAIRHTMPAGARLVHIGIQHWESFPIQAWFEVDPEREPEERILQLHPTGVPFDGIHLATVQHDQSRTVWHLLDVTGVR